MSHIRVVCGRRVVGPEGVRPATILIDSGRIAAVGDYEDRTISGGDVVDAGDLIVLPGLVDTHVHVNEPGRTEWEGFASGTRAAAAGGVTTIVDMPLNSIPSTTTVAALDAKRAAALGQCHVDVGIWGGVVPGNAGELAPLARAGVLGFKAFLSPSGVAEFEHVSESDLRVALPILAELDVPLLVHAEDPEQLREPLGDPRTYSTWLASRPAAAERSAIAMLIRLAREFGARIHVVHLASTDSIAAVAAARAAGIRLSVETCPHYLAFAAEEIRDGQTSFKCAPPIRERAHRDSLWSGLRDGHIDLVATDHSPAPAALKNLADGDFVRAWGGIASLQLGLRATWTAMAARGIDLARIAEWMAAAPARLAGLEHRKGAIAPGCDADLVVFDPDAESTVRAADLYHRHAVTPYDGLRLRGAIRMTLLAGNVIFDRDVCRDEPAGRLLSRPR